MEIACSARRHGVSDEAIRHALTNAVRLIDTDDGLFVIGADHSGQFLELVARATEAGDSWCSTPCCCGPPARGSTCREEAP
jgi:hypothetical protein